MLGFRRYKNQVNNEPEVAPDTELLIAQKALSAAKQRLADATESKLSAQRKAIADAEAAAIQKRNQELQEYEAKVAVHLQRAKEKEEARLAEQRAKETETRRMQEELAKLELQRQDQRKHEELLQRVADEAARIEREAAQAEQEALRMSVPPVVVEPEITLQSPSHPLSFLWRTQECTGAEQPEPTPPPAVVYPLPPTLRPESPSERSLLMSAFTNKGLCVNPLTIVNMSLRFEPAPIMRALEIVMSDARLQNTYAVQAIEAILWRPEENPEEIINSVIVTREAEKVRREAEKVRCEEESRRG